MIFHKKEKPVPIPKEPIEEYLDRFYADFIQIKTCCECIVYLRYTTNRYQVYGDSSKFKEDIRIKKVCDMHKVEASNKYVEEIRKELK